MPGFLIVYNRITGEVAVTEFLSETGHREAMQARLDLEETRTDPDVEIMSIGSDSLDTVRVTHSRYFMREHLFAA